MVAKGGLIVLFIHLFTFYTHFFKRLAPALVFAPFVHPMVWLYLTKALSIGAGVSDSFFSRQTCILEPPLDNDEDKMLK